MAWFVRNKYASHPEILDRIASKGADIALAQIQEYLEYTKRPCTYCELSFRYLRFNNKPLEISWGSPCRCSELQFSDFNMEGVPCDDEVLFLSAIAPYFQKHLDAKLKQYFPTASGVTATKTKYQYFKDTVEAIEITVSGVGNPASKPALNKW